MEKDKKNSIKNPYFKNPLNDVNVVFIILKPLIRR
jgi:hypothetical protein